MVLIDESGVLLAPLVRRTLARRGQTPLLFQNAQHRDKVSLLAALTERMGWRIALLLVCAMLAVAAFAVLMLMRDRPSDLGLRPFGDEGTEPLPAPPPNTAPIMAAALGTLRDSAKTKVFWILFATFFICGASTNGLIQVTDDFFRHVLFRAASSRDRDDVEILTAVEERHLIRAESGSRVGIE